VGTAKRERQKANRQIRLQELAKEARKEKSRKLAMRITLSVLGFFAVVGVIYAVGHNSSSSSAATTTSSATGDTTLISGLNPGSSTTAAAPTYSTLPKPKVQIPTNIPTALKTTVLTEGTGTGATAGDSITVNYIGVLSSDGTTFDNSYDRGQPFTFVLGAGNVIKGWDQGLEGAKVGSRVQLDIPSSLAYGASGQGSIKPNSALTFVVDVLAITPAAPATTATPTTPAPTTT
jgi:peptidylprolyl isomerase